MIRIQWSDFVSDWAGQLAGGMVPPVDRKRMVRLPASPQGGRGRSTSTEKTQDSQPENPHPETPKRKLPREGAPSLTPRSRELVSVLKGTPTPDSPFTMDLLNSLVEEETRKQRDDGQRVTIKDFMQKWHYNQKAAPPGEALLQTFTSFGRECVTGTDETASRLGAMLKEAWHGASDRAGLDLVLKALDAWRVQASNRSRCLGTACPARDHEGTRCGTTCVGHALDPNAKV